MKFEVKQPTAPPISTGYPYLGITKVKGDLVVLFTNYQKGVVVSSSDDFTKVGSFGDDWCESNFTRLPAGTVVTITQE